MKRIDPRIIVIIGVMFVSFSSILIKLSNAPSLIIATYRLAFSVLLLLPSFIHKGVTEIKEVDRRTIYISIVSGIFLALHFATWITSIKYTSITSSTVLVNIHPVFIVIGSYLILKEVTSRRALLNIGITLIGSIVISAGDFNLGREALYGDMLAILGAFFVSGYMIIGRLARSKMSVMLYTFIVYLSSTVTLFLMSILMGLPLYPYSVKEFATFLALAVFSTLLGHSIYSWALEYVRPTFISTATLGEPVFATIWAFIIFGEVPSIWLLIGSTVVLYGIFSFIRVNRRGNSPIDSK